MSEREHTPGPWTVVPPMHGSPTEYLCVQMGADERYATLEMRPADARLTAAAPDLLAACEKLLSACAADAGLRRELGYDFEDELRAAVARARGR